MNTHAKNTWNISLRRLLTAVLMFCFLAGVCRLLLQSDDQTLTSIGALVVFPAVIGAPIGFSCGGWVGFLKGVVVSTVMWIGVVGIFLLM